MNKKDKPTIKEVFYAGCFISLVMAIPFIANTGGLESILFLIAFPFGVALLWWLVDRGYWF